MPKHAFNLATSDLKPAHLRGIPACSWWADGDFYTRARHEQDRMAQSTYGKASALAFGRDHARTTSRDTDELEARA